MFSGSQGVFLGHFLGARERLLGSREFFPGFPGEYPVSLGEFSRFQASFPRNKGAKNSFDSVPAKA